MRELLRRIGPRYGISLGLILAVLIVIAAGKLLGHGTNTPLVTDRGTSSGSDTSTSTATGPPDDGEPSPQAPVPPSTSPGAADPLTVATKFTNAWLHHTGVSQAQWAAGVNVYATSHLTNQLKGTDPAGVPADRITGDFVQINFSPSYVQYSVSTDSGTLTLYLQADKGRWLVSGIDWTRA